MIKILDKHIPELEFMKKYPSEISYIGNSDLLKKTKVSIIGTRKPNQYTKHFTYLLSQKLASVGVCIVSGAAMGVDAIAHSGAGAANTISVVANGLDIRYPVVNKALIEAIEQEGLILSQFNNGFRATSWSFVVRNELVVALGDILIVTEADLNSGSIRSVEYALKMKKKIYVLPHRLGESEGTNELVKQGLANEIHNVDEFVSQFGTIAKISDDPFLQFCSSNPTFDEAVLKYNQTVFEYELDGKISIDNGRVGLIC